MEEVISVKMFGDEDFFWMAANDLAFELAPDCPTREMFAIYQSNGYNYEESGDHENAVDCWFFAWETFKKLNKNTYKCVSDLELSAILMPFG